MILWLLLGLANAARPSIRATHPGVARTREFVDVLPEELLQQLEKDCEALAKYNNELPVLMNSKKQTYWFPNKVSPRTSFEEAIKYLQPLAKLSEGFVGAEWWIQKIPAVGASGTLGFHVDKDESVASLKHYLVHPEYSSVFYLTSHGGGTLIVDQWSPEGNGYEPKEPEEGELSMPLRNKYIVFNGELLHGVVPSRIPSPGASPSRVTFLVNFWDHVPEAPNCVPANYTAIAAKGVSVWSKEERSSWKRKRSNKKGVEVPLSVVDLRPRTKTKVPSYGYDIALPGEAKETVRLPVEVPLGSTSTIKWKKTSSQEQLQSSNPSVSRKVEKPSKVEAPVQSSTVDQPIAKGPPPTMAPRLREQEEHEMKQEQRELEQEKQKLKQEQSLQQQAIKTQPQQLPVKAERRKEDYAAFRQMLQQTVDNFEPDNA